LIVSGEYEKFLVVIDWQLQKEKSKTASLFSVSRNPILLGMLLVLAGLFLLILNAAKLILYGLKSADSNSGKVGRRLFTQAA
jgi:protein-S-isoprenylcysteine O-methyltransferase Ste14